MVLPPPYIPPLPSSFTSLSPSYHPSSLPACLHPIPPLITCSLSSWLACLSESCLNSSVSLRHSLICCSGQETRRVNNQLPSWAATSIDLHVHPHLHMSTYIPQEQQSLLQFWCSCRDYVPVGKKEDHVKNKFSSEMMDTLYRYLEYRDSPTNKIQLTGCLMMHS